VPERGQIVPASMVAQSKAEPHVAASPIVLDPVGSGPLKSRIVLSNDCVNGCLVFGSSRGTLISPSCLGKDASRAKYSSPTPTK
jgi:hypothetical protein